MNSRAFGPVAVVFVVSALHGCEAQPGGSDDAGRGRDGSLACTSLADCDDGRFCNGAERCSAGDPAADERGCAPPLRAPCSRCDEALDRCIVDCGVATDDDGDGFDAIACGGSDCDDSDPQRNPGALELCDTDNKDEDCDTATFGPRRIGRIGHPNAGKHGGAHGKGCRGAWSGVNVGDVGERISRA